MSTCRVELSGKSDRDDKSASVSTFCHRLHVSVLNSRTSDDPFVSSRLIPDLFSSFKGSNIHIFTKASQRWTPGSPWMSFTFSEIKYRPWQHRYLNQIARRVLSSNTENINGLFLFYAQTHCFSLPWSNVPGNLSTVLILLVCSYQDQICACERLMNEVLCLRKTSVKCCSLK